MRRALVPLVLGFLVAGMACSDNTLHKQPQPKYPANRSTARGRMPMGWRGRASGTITIAATTSAPASNNGHHQLWWAVAGASFSRISSLSSNRPHIRVQQKKSSALCWSRSRDLFPELISCLPLVRSASTRGIRRGIFATPRSLSRESTIDQHNAQLRCTRPSATGLLLSHVLARLRWQSSWRTRTGT